MFYVHGTLQSKKAKAPVPEELTNCETIERLNKGRKLLRSRVSSINGRGFYPAETPSSEREGGKYHLFSFPCNLKQKIMG